MTNSTITKIIFPSFLIMFSPLKPYLKRIKLKLHVPRDVSSSSVGRSVESLISIEKYVKYASSHYVEELDANCQFAEFSLFNPGT